MRSLLVEVPLGGLDRSVTCGGKEDDSTNSCLPASAYEESGRERAAHPHEWAFADQRP